MEWRCSSTYFYSRHSRKMNCQPHAPSTLLPAKLQPVAIEHKDMWALEPVWTLWRRYLLPPPGNEPRFPGSSNPEISLSSVCPVWFFFLYYFLCYVSFAFISPFLCFYYFRLILKTTSYELFSRKIVAGCCYFVHVLTPHKATVSYRTGDQHSRTRHCLAARTHT